MISDFLIVRSCNLKLKQKIDKLRLELDLKVDLRLLFICQINDNLQDELKLLALTNAGLVHDVKGICLLRLTNGNVLGSNLQWSIFTYRYIYSPAVSTG